MGNRYHHLLRHFRLHKGEVPRYRTMTGNENRLEIFFHRQAYIIILLYAVTVRLQCSLISSYKHTFQKEIVIV